MFERSETAQRSWLLNFPISFTDWAAIIPNIFMLLRQDYGRVNGSREIEDAFPALRPLGLTLFDGGFCGPVAAGVQQNA